MVVVVGIVAVIRGGVIVGADGGHVDDTGGGGRCHRRHPWGLSLTLMVVVVSTTLVVVVSAVMVIRCLWRGCRRRH